MAVWEPRPAATSEDIERLKSLIPGVPEALVRFLQRSNGGEGPLGLQPMWLQLFSTDEIIDVSGDEFYCTEFSDYLFFGTNGGLEMLAFDKRNRFGIVMIDPIAGIGSLISIAADFSNLEAAIGKEFQQNA